MNTLQNQLYPTTELMSVAVLGTLDDQEVNKIKDDAKGYLFAKTNIDLGDIAVNTVENTNSQINLTLPYYSLVDEVSAQALTDSSIEDAAGGFEIFFSIGTAVTVIAGTLFGAGAAAAVGGAAISVGVAVVAAGIAAGAVAIGTVAVGTGVGVTERNKK